MSASHAKANRHLSITVAKPADLVWINKNYQSYGISPCTSAYLVAIATIGDTYVGLIRAKYIANSTAALDGLWVSDDWRSCGIARALVAWLTAKLAGTSIVYKCDEASKALAMNLGFRDFQSDFDVDNHPASADLATIAPPIDQWMILGNLCTPSVSVVAEQRESSVQRKAS